MKYIKGLNGLRAISIILVLVMHLGLHDLFKSSEYLSQRVWPIISGHTGVNIFFVLSGFLITSILLKTKESNNKISLKEFYIKRILRLGPALIIFYIVLLFLILTKFVFIHKIELIASLTYFYNFLPKNLRSPEMGHFWSLSVEEQFYIFWPIVISIFSIKTIRYILFFLLSMCFITKFYEKSISLNETYRVYQWFIPGAAPILTGSLASLYIKDSTYKIKYKTLISSMLFLSSLYLPNSLLILTPYIQAIGTAIFIFWVLENQSSLTVSLLEDKVLSYIGKVSYGLYLYQGIFLTTNPKGGNQFFQNFPVNIIITILITVISYHSIEKYFLNTKQKMFSKK
jgi:peptidoglycan/LPS O-acetylase OafA/YrhL